MEPIMTTFKGNRVFIFDPDPDTIRIEDIAHHLSLQNRFNGGTIRPYSVAAHCVYISNHLVDEEHAFEGLMHDAAEAYIGDMISPLKRHMPEFNRLEEQFYEVIANKFGLPVKLSEEVEEADRLAAQIEMFQLRTQHMQDVDDRVITAPELSYANWEEVKWKFLDRFSELAP